MNGSQGFVSPEVIRLPWHVVFERGDWALELYASLPFHSGITGAEVDIWTPYGSFNASVDRLTPEALRDIEGWD